MSCTINTIWVHADSAPAVMLLPFSPPVDVYGCMLTDSKKTQALFRLLKVKVEREVEFQKQAFQLLGSVNTLLTVATQTRTVVTAAEPLGIDTSLSVE